MKAALTPQGGKTWCKLEKNKKYENKKRKMSSKKPLKGTGWEKW